MNSTCIPRGLAVAAALVLSSGAFAAGELRALGESEMSAVYGRGLGDTALHVLGALSARDQSDSGVSAAAAAEAQAELAAASGDLQNLDRQLAQQRLQAAATGVQATILVTQTLLAADKALAPIASSLTPVMPGLPLLSGLPSLAALEAIQNKH